MCKRKKVQHEKSPTQKKGATRKKVQHESSATRKKVLHECNTKKVQDEKAAI